MTVTIHLAQLRRTQMREYALRLLFGGLVTAGAGLIAQHFGPGAGGLFLAFPAIFPAGATLVEKHQIEKKRDAGLSGKKRGAQAAALDAVGAAIGSFGLIGFAVLVWLLLQDHRAWPILLAATAAWLVISTGIWQIRRLTKHRATLAVS